MNKDSSKDTEVWNSTECFNDDFEIDESLKIDFKKQEKFEK